MGECSLNARDRSQTERNNKWILLRSTIVKWHRNAQSQNIHIYKLEYNNNIYRPLFLSVAFVFSSLFFLGRSEIISDPILYNSLSYHKIYTLFQRNIISFLFLFRAFPFYTLILYLQQVCFFIIRSSCRDSRYEIDVSFFA